MPDETIQPDLQRIFLALPVPATVAAKLAALQRELRPALPGMAWTRPGQMHLTLRFYGQVPGVQLPPLRHALERICETQPPFTLRVARVGAFGRRVIWAGIAGELERLRELEQAVREATEGFGDHVEEREFAPHLTLGRVKRGQRAPGAEWIARHERTRFGAWHVTFVDLMQSELQPQGSHHSLLARMPLRPG